MPAKHSEPVRMPLRARERSHRTIDQRLALRFPGPAVALYRLVDLFPPRSRIRRLSLQRAARMGLEAYNRRDLEAASLAFTPDLEYYPYREFVEAGLAEACYHWPAGYRAYIEATYEVWGTDVKVYPTELIDLGDRVVVLADMPMTAQASGISLAETYACVATLRGGRVCRQRDFLHHAEALEAAGLS
jgi:ketosteroid isomerase-like protein